MSRSVFVAVVLFAVTELSFAANPQVEIKTNQGSMLIELYPDKAPKTVENFLQYVKDGYFKGTIFHRVIPGFMIQGGGFTHDFTQKPTRAPVANEANNGLKNDKGTLAMARTSDPNSATAQFFINVADNDFLNHKAPNPRGWGYCVFGKVLKGMETADRIVAIPTGAGGPFPTDVPSQEVIIEDMHLVSGNKE
jgi:peptidyl-prolyl cis-trans isomerase A (cyclophilin A)/peptidyl-prolyl cis-trans isomerase B (cyclophilin B)